MISELSSYLPGLKDTHKKTPVENRLKIINLLTDNIQNNFVSYEPNFVVNILPTILDRLDDKPFVVESTMKLGTKLMESLSVQAFPLILDIMASKITPESKWKVKDGCLSLLNVYLKRIEMYDRELLSACLPQLVKLLTPLLHDTKLQVAENAKETCLIAFKGITNKDLEPFIDELLETIIDRDKTESTIQKLGGIVFVQTVEGSALSVVVPLMIAGFKSPKSGIKRMCSKIVNNMVKLVENPVEILPFLLELIPQLEESINTINDPEARQVATTTFDALKLLEMKANNTNSNFRDVSVIEKEIMSHIEPIEEEYVKYLATITNSLIMTKTTCESEYNDELETYLEMVDQDSKSTIIKYLYDQSQKVILLDTNDDLNAEDDVLEDLCDCDFTLAYGTNILLHNTKLRLKKGRKYGLLGKNDSGKTTLMKAIADGSVDGFPDSDEVKTVFVEADIQGELSHLDCVNYVLEHPEIKSLNATEQTVRDVLKRVGFSEGKMAGEGGDCDDPISSLSGGWRMKLALARAMIQNADILLMDEPTNHLDVTNVKWVINYINSLKNTTVVMVSHDSGLLDDCCDYILQIDALKLKLHRGNLTSFVKDHPEAMSYFEFKASKATPVSFCFPRGSAPLTTEPE